MKVDILVLNYNGKDLLGRFLPSICDAAKKSSNDCKVWMIDNVSGDGSLEFTKNNFPDVNAVSTGVNRVLFSYNDIVKGLDSDVVIFMNNDIRVKEDFVDHLIGHFNDTRAFFVAPCILNMDGTYNGGKSHFEFMWGIVRSVIDRDSYKDAGYTQMISCGAFRRDLFLKFGGFDDLYSPGIWEDADLCYRALKCGYAGIYEPRSVIWHDESTTFNRVYGRRSKNVIAHRNMFLFFLKNIHDGMFMTKHLFFLPVRLIHSIMFAKAELAEGFIKAIPKLPDAILSRRRTRKEPRILKDRDIVKCARRHKDVI